MSARNRYPKPRTVLDQVTPAGPELGAQPLNGYATVRVAIVRGRLPHSFQQMAAGLARSATLGERQQAA